MFPPIENCDLRIKNVGLRWFLHPETVYTYIYVCVCRYSQSNIQYWIPFPYLYGPKIIDGWFRFGAVFFWPICIVIDASPAAITNQAIFKTMSSSLTNHDMFFWYMCFITNRRLWIVGTNFLNVANPIKHPLNVHKWVLQTIPKAVWQVYGIGCPTSYQYNGIVIIKSLSCQSLLTSYLISYQTYFTLVNTTFVNIQKAKHKNNFQTV